MVFEGNWKIFIQDDVGKYTIAVRRADNNLLARFDCAYAAEQYAKYLGLKDFIVKK